MVILKGSDSPAMYYSSTIPWMRLKKKAWKRKDLMSCVVGGKDIGDSTVSPSGALPVVASSRGMFPRMPL